jgi:hypothetical protein
MTQQYPPHQPPFGEPDPQQWRGYGAPRGDGVTDDTEALRQRMGGAHQAPMPPKPKRKKWPWIVVAVVLLFVVVVVANSGDNTTPARPAAGVPSGVDPATINASPTPVAGGLTEEAVPAGPVTTMGNGTYQVGTDVVPGKYRSPAPTDGLCYFDQTDDSGKILDQGVANEGPSIANLRKGRTFKSSGCEDWVKVG